MNASTKAQQDAVLQKLLSIKEQGTQTPGAMKVTPDESGIPLNTIYGWSSKLSRTTQRLSAHDSSGTRTSAAKFAAVVATSAMSELEVGAYCRSNEILQEDLEQWKKLCHDANAHLVTWAQQIRNELNQERAKSKALIRERPGKEKALAETAALLVLRGKQRRFWRGTTRVTDLTSRSPNSGAAHRGSQ